VTLRRLATKAGATPSPWSKALLDKVQKEGVTEGVTDLMEDSSLRKSKRMEKQRNGFKHSQCTKGCLGCTITPPTLSTSVIRNLGASFCNLDEESLTAPIMNKKKMHATPGGKKQTKKKPSYKDNADNKS